MILSAFIIINMLNILFNSYYETLNNYEPLYLKFDLIDSYD